MNPAPAAPASRWLAFASLSLIYFVISAGAFSSLGVVLPSMVTELKWNWQQAGLGYTLLGVACGLASFVPAVLIRRIGVRGTMAAGLVTMLAGFGTMATTQSVWGYLAATTLIGIAFSLVSTVPGSHVLTELFKNRSTALGAYFAIGTLGGVAGPLIYVLIDGLTGGWRPYWWAFVAMSTVAGLFAIATTPKRHDESAHQTAAPEQVGPGELVEGLRDWTVRRALMTPQFYVIFGVYTTYLLINTTAHAFGAEHLIEHNVAKSDAAFMLSIEAAVGVAVSVLGGWLGERVSTKTLMLICMGAVAIGQFALAEARDWGLMSVFAVGVGIGYGLSFTPPTVMLLKYFGKKPNLELFSIMCLLSTVAAAGPAFGGWARDTLGSFEGLFVLCGAITVAMFLATLFLRPPRLNAVAEPAPVGSPAE
ncbi:MAG TPA: MFS transporter [Caulobacteraceae bacterium]|nr:MFS transporter [Caulobacteraceae bacterium]